MQFITLKWLIIYESSSEITFQRAFTLAPCSIKNEMTFGVLRMTALWSAVRPFRRALTSQSDNAARIWSIESFLTPSKRFFTDSDSSLWKTFWKNKNFENFSKFSFWSEKKEKLGTWSRGKWYNLAHLIARLRHHVRQFPFFEHQKTVPDPFLTFWFGPGFLPRIGQFGKLGKNSRKLLLIIIYLHIE